MNRLGLGLTPEQIVKSIEVLDTDGDGEISLVRADTHAPLASVAPRCWLRCLTQNARRAVRLQEEFAELLKEPEQPSAQQRTPRRRLASGTPRGSSTNSGAGPGGGTASQFGEEEVRALRANASETNRWA